jgi:hypothetical protein
MAIRRQDECRPEPDLEDPQWHAGTPAPARSVREFETADQMSDSRQGDHRAQNREQEDRSDIGHEHDRAGHGSDRAGEERESAAWALRRQAPPERDDPVEHPVDAHEVHQRGGRAVACRARASPRTIDIAPRRAVIQTSAIGPGVRAERCGLVLSD